MSAENVEPARRNYAAWERGDFSDASWAADDIEYESRFIPHARVRGVTSFGCGYADFTFSVGPGEPES